MQDKTFWDFDFLLTKPQIEHISAEDFMHMNYLIPWGTVGYFLFQYWFLNFVPEIFYSDFSFTAGRQNSRKLFESSSGFLTLKI